MFYGGWLTCGNNHRAQLGSQQLPSAQVNGIYPAPKPIHVNGRLSSDFQRTLERDQS